MSSLRYWPYALPFYPHSKLHYHETHFLWAEVVMDIPVGGINTHPWLTVLLIHSLYETLHYMRDSPPALLRNKKDVLIKLAWRLLNWGYVLKMYKKKVSGKGGGRCRRWGIELKKKTELNFHPFHSNTYTLDILILLLLWFLLICYFQETFLSANILQ